MDSQILRAELKEHYQIELGERLGEGGFGRVYAARTAAGVPCAIKASHAPIRESGDWGDTERKALESVKTLTGHPHICTLFDIWEIRGYLVTRWELGETCLSGLLKHCRQQGLPGIPRDDLLGYMHEAADALDFLNRTQGVYHRDVKPENLLLFFGHVKLVDLGLAKFAGASSASHTGYGTASYMPPEAWDKHRLSSTCDLYCLAATYIRLRTGNDPFGDPQNLKELVLRKLALRPTLDGLDSAEAEWVCRALAVEPANRPQDGAVAWVASLRRCVLGATGPTPAFDVPSPAAVPAGLASVEVRAFRIEPPAIAIEPVPSAAPVLEPPIPADILQLQGRIGALERAVATLKDESHPSLAPAKGTLEEARAQWLRLQQELERRGEAIPRDVRRKLIDRLCQEPGIEAHRLCDAAGDVSATVLVGYAQRWRDVQYARQVLDGVIGQYREMVQRTAAELEDQLTPARKDLATLQEKDLQDAVAALSESLCPAQDSIDKTFSATWPQAQDSIDKTFSAAWPQWEPLLASRVYPWEAQTLRAKADESFKIAYDDRAWKSAESANTVDAYLAYLEAVSHGQKEQEARERLADCARGEFLGGEQACPDKSLDTVADLLRKRLLNDMANVRLRKCYLALRPPALGVKDTKRALLASARLLRKWLLIAGSLLGAGLAVFLCLLGGGEVQFPLCVLLAVVTGFLLCALSVPPRIWLSSAIPCAKEKSKNSLFFESPLAIAIWICLAPHILTSVAISREFAIPGLVSWSASVPTAGCWTYGILGAIAGYATLGGVLTSYDELVFREYVHVGPACGPLPYKAYRLGRFKIRKTYTADFPDWALR